LPQTPHIERHFTASERLREQQEIREKAGAEADEVRVVLQSYGLTAEESAPIVAALCRRPEAWVDFMTRFELGLEAPDPKRAVTSALTIAGAYVAGGLIPLAPYLLFSSARDALNVSVIATLGALAVFGAIKGHFTGTKPSRSALQTGLVGGLAATAAFVIARVIAWCLKRKSRHRTAQPRLLSCGASG
jgi:VIT1/CCC1 family predicted Fe2+/Mn2+ transporter